VRTVLRSVSRCRPVSDLVQSLRRFFVHHFSLVCAGCGCFLHGAAATRAGRSWPGLQPFAWGGAQTCSERCSAAWRCLSHTDAAGAGKRRFVDSAAIGEEQEPHSCGPPRGRNDDRPVLLLWLFGTAPRQAGVVRRTVMATAFPPNIVHGVDLWTGRVSEVHCGPWTKSVG
jgi:hypothetical protein